MVGASRRLRDGLCESWAPKYPYLQPLKAKILPNYMNSWTLRDDELRKLSLQKLGPVFVKVGQTLAQRPDIVGDEAADVLKTLQSKSAPFADEIAHRTWAVFARHSRI